jgi:hypothetical protein
MAIDIGEKMHPEAAAAGVAQCIHAQPWPEVGPPNADIDDIGDRTRFQFTHQRCQLHELLLRTVISSLGCRRLADVRTQRRVQRRPLFRHVDPFAIHQSLQCLLQVDLFGYRKQSIQCGAIIFLAREVGIDRPHAQ